MKILFLLFLCMPVMSYGQSTGTGFAIHSSGYIATNFHVIEGSDKITVKGINGNHNESYEAIVVKIDKANDLAILKIGIPLGEIPYRFKRPKEDVASTVYAYGYLLPELQGYEVKITEGIINSNSGFRGNPVEYQHTASISSGNSGGPLFNKYGDLVGINNAGIDNALVREIYGTETENVNYAIKSRYLLNLMEDLDLEIETDNDISQLELSQQYKEIKPFVYFIISSTIRSRSPSFEVLKPYPKPSIPKPKTKPKTKPKAGYLINYDHWYADFDEAAAAAAGTGRDMIVDFTGSDW